MLRITIHDSQSPRRLELAGKLAGEWVAEMEKAFKADGVGKQTEVDLTAVTGVDEAGRRLLRAMTQAGATLITKGLAMTALVDEMRSLAPAEAPRLEEAEETVHEGNDNDAKSSEDIQREAADLHTLAFLLTGRPDVSIDIAADAVVSEDGTNSFFGDWMRDWRRRLVIAKALTAVRDELSASARRTKRARLDASVAAQPDWSTRPDVTKADLERALLAIDLFPRAALLLLVFEGLRVADATSLLDVDAGLLKKAQVIGLQQLTANLTPTKAGAVSSSTQHKMRCPTARRRAGKTQLGLRPLAGLRPFSRGIASLSTEPLITY